jgi:two-component system response regulator (stage 0 sporulation protein A)
MDKIKVLIVDDNRDFRMTVAKYLEGNGEMEIIGEASDGNEAIEIINKKDIDVILLDVIMPNKDGLYILEEMKGISNDLVSKTIIVSALTQEDIIKRATDLGVSFYIAKPFSGKALLSHIQKASGRTNLTHTNTQKKKSKNTYTAFL